MLRFRGIFLPIMPYHSSTERQCSDFWVDFGTFERICSVFQGHSMVIFMTEWVDSDVLNWVGMLRFRQLVYDSGGKYKKNLQKNISFICITILHSHSISEYSCAFLHQVLPNQSKTQKYYHVAHVQVHHLV